MGTCSSTTIGFFSEIGADKDGEIALKVVVLVDDVVVVVGEVLIVFCLFVFLLFILLDVK